jgi:3-methyladenine DNA glycosylase AlkC
MAEAFKNLLNSALIAHCARHFARVWPAFPAAAFIEQAGARLEALELKARAMQMADALDAVLPLPFATRADVIEAVLAAPLREAAGMGSVTPDDSGLRGWVLWPLGEVIARSGLNAPERALAVLRELTQRFTAEWAIRPLLVAHPDLGQRTLLQWTADPNQHVRRLASEGSRPRLPWGMLLRDRIADPTPSFALIERLLDDPSDYVRLSAANHLNDIAKDHPARVVAFIAQHLPGASNERGVLLKHGARTLIKRGDLAALKLWGRDQAFVGDVALRVTPQRLSIGAACTLELTLSSTAPTPQALLIDYRIAYAGASGPRAPKVFKGWKLTLAPDARLNLKRAIKFAPVTTRTLHLGVQTLDVQINGEVRATAALELA